MDDWRIGIACLISSERCWEQEFMEDLGELVLSDRPHITMKPALQAKQKKSTAQANKNTLYCSFRVILICDAIVTLYSLPRLETLVRDKLLRRYPAVGVLDRQ